MALLHDQYTWLILSFLIFCFIVFKLGKAILLSALDARIAKIKEDLKTAEDLRVEAQEMLAQYQRKHRDSIDEAREIVARAEKHALQIKENAEKELEENIARREEQLKDRLRRMEDSAVDDIRKYASAIAIQVTREVIEGHMDKKSGDSLIKDSVSNITRRFH